MSKKVEIYSTPTCHFCAVAKDFLKDHGVEFNEYDVIADTEKRVEMMDRTGQLGVPVIVVSGETPEEEKIMVGFNEHLLREVLEI